MFSAPLARCARPLPWRVLSRPAFGWIILRHVRSAAGACPTPWSSPTDPPPGHVTQVRSADDDLVWRENARRIRLHFPCDPILVIDNRSNRTMYPAMGPIPRGPKGIVFSSCDEYAPCTVVMYDALAAGEYLPYHLMHSLRPFERAAFLFDSAMPLPHAESRGFDHTDPSHAAFAAAVRVRSLLRITPPTDRYTSY